MQLTGQGRAEEQSNFHKDIRRQLPVEGLVFGFPVTSLCLAFLNYKAERAITTLRSLLSAQESFRARPADHPALELSAARRLIPSTG